MGRSPSEFALERFLPAVVEVQRVGPIRVEAAEIPARHKGHDGAVNASKFIFGVVLNRAKVEHGRLVALRWRISCRTTNASILLFRLLLASRTRRP